ncbi:MAG: hypothetical protein AAGE89_16520 [Pseudomonadota bacterium]
MSEDAINYERNTGHLLVYPETSESFANGFETGEIYGQMLAGVKVIEPLTAFPQSLRDFFVRMAEAVEYDLEIMDAADGRFICVFRKKRTTTPLHPIK